MVTKVCLSIAGFDGSGGAGMQADLKTFSALGCYGMTVLTALPIQNTVGVRACYDLPFASIAAQLSALFEDIRPHAIKIGMLFSGPIIQVVADFLQANAKGIPIVLDPVMVAKSGDPLLLPDAVLKLKTALLPLATIITPNLPEAYTLLGESIAHTASHTVSSSQCAVLAQSLLDAGGQAVLLKGGHASGEVVVDTYRDRDGGQATWSTPRVRTRNTHGTGCTLSAAIAAFLAQGATREAACQQAKTYLYQALCAAREQTLGQGHGPVHHFYHWW